MKKTLYILLTTVFVLTACAEYEKEISWKLDDYPEMLVVEGNITNEFKQQFVKLTKTAAYFDTLAPEAVSGAEVVVREGNQVYFFSESDTHKGLYLSDIPFSGAPLKTYKLEVVLPEPLNGATNYSAVSTMPEGIDLDSIVCEIYEMPDLGFEEDDEEKDTTLLAITYYGKEPDDPDNYYVARIFRNNTCWQKNVKEVLLYNDDYSNGYDYENLLYNRNLAANDSIQLEIRSVEKNYFDFITGIQLIDESGSAYSMSGPPANAVGNISGGRALGFFSATYLSRAKGIAVDMR